MERSGRTVLTVVGNRPQFIKAAAVSAHLRERAEEVLVHTGQHYDPELSDVFFEQLEMPAPDRELGIGSGSHSEQPAAILTRHEPLVAEIEPGALLVYGDTNSKLACVPATAPCPRRSTAWSSTRSPACCSVRPKLPCETCATRGEMSRQ